MLYSKGDIIKACCKDLPIGTIFRYRLRKDEMKDTVRTDKLYLIYEDRKNHSAICIDTGNPGHSVSNQDYKIELEIIRYGPK